MNTVMAQAEVLLGKQSLSQGRYAGILFWKNELGIRSGRLDTESQKKENLSKVSMHNIQKGKYKLACTVNTWDMVP